MKKVVFLKVVRGGSPGSECGGPHATALVLQRSADGYLSIQGHPPVPWAERQECWLLFRRAAKRLLGVCEASPVSVSLSEPPHATVADLGAVFRQPSHIVSLTFSPLRHEAQLEREADEKRRERARETTDGNCYRCLQEPTAASSGLYNPPRPSPLSSPRTKRRGDTSEKARCGREEMARLLAGLDKVSQTLERTQSRCEAIARRCGSARREREEADCSGDDDSRVEQLLRVAESLTAQIVKQQQQQQQQQQQLRRSPTPTVTGVSLPRQPTTTMTSSESEGGVVPDAPSDVSTQPSINGGIFIFWRPVRLDEQDRNNGCKVAGYNVYVDGVQRSKVDEPFGSHAEVEGLEGGREYRIQVSTLTSDNKESSLSTAVQYRHEVHSLARETPPPTHQKQSSKVENWLLASSQSPSHISTLTGRTPDDATPPNHTHLSEDAWSMGSSHTSGIVMDHPPSSPKLTPSYCHGDGFSIHSGATTMIVDGGTALSPYHHHQLRFSPSPSATPTRARSHTPKGDRVIDEPLDMGSISADEAESGKAAATVRLVVGSRHRGPAPPGNVRVSQRQPGWLHVTWTPTKRDGMGCSNGCFVLGYRVYINGTSQTSIDGPMTYESSIRWPHPDSAHKIEVHVRTRSIAAESLPSHTVLYDPLLRGSVEKYSGVKVNSPLSSTTTLCPRNSPRPLHKPPPARVQGAVAKETYV